MKSNPADNGAVRDTEIGPIPTDWRLVRLRDVTFEGTDRNRDLEYSRSDVLGVDNEEGLIPSERLLGEDFSRYKLVRKHQFAYNPMRLNVGSIGLWGEDKTAIVSPDYIVFGCQEDELDPDFMDLFRRSATWDWQIRQSGQGSVRIRYYYRHIADFFIPLPPLREQQRIASALRSVQKARNAVKQVYDAIRESKISLTKHLLTYGPVEFSKAGAVEMKETVVGQIPTSWQTTRIGDLCDPQSGGTPPRSNPGLFKGTTPWVKTLDLNEGLVVSTEECITDEGLQVIRGKVRPIGTVMIAMYGGAGTVGKTGMLGIPAATNQAVCCLEPAPDKYVSAYLLEYLISIRPEWMKEAVGTRKDPNIGKGIIANRMVPLPPLKVQQVIAEKLAAVNRKVRAEKQSLIALDELFHSMLHDLMAARNRIEGPCLRKSEAV